ncbi:HDOD domain-containing protein [Glaciecola sp. SC05]|uniref:HDOD domain-containing protein n=1 Tax=Glaciecola sp. SC05 TaxID=1987355 RepID=UPI003528C033
MDTSSILIPVVIIFGVVILLWRLKASNQDNDYSNTLLKVRKKRKGTIYAEPKSPANMVKESTAKKAPAIKEKPIEVPEVPEDFLSLELIHYLEFQRENETAKGFKNLRKPHPLLMSLSRSITDAQELINIVKSDPELVAMVLNMANSPFFGLRKAITDINHAVIYLGIAQVKNLATQFAISQSFAFESDSQKEAYERIWKTSFLASAMALYLAREVDFENPSELSTRCLLNYLGDITLLSMQPTAANFYLNGMPLFMRIKGMQSLFKTNAAVMGGIFGQHLKLPAELHQGIGLGYHPMKNNWDNVDITPEEKQNILFCYAVCRVAEYFVLEGDASYSKLPSIDYQVSHKPELFNLIEQLEACGLGSLNALLQSPRGKMKLSQMLADLKKSV